MVNTILILHSSSIIAGGLKTFLSSINSGDIRVYNSYFKCLDAVLFLQNLGETFVVIVEGTMLDTPKCKQLAKFNQAVLILCDPIVVQSSLLLALNSNSSYISLEDSDPKTLILAVQCALAGSVFICPQAKSRLNSCIFESKLVERKAIAQLSELDQQILALTAQGYTQIAIGKIVNYSSLNVGHRLREIVRNLNLQTKQEAITLANSIGLNLSLEEQAFQTA